MEGEYRKIGNKWEREQNVEDHDDGDNTGDNMEKEGKTINGGFSNGEKVDRKRALIAGGCTRPVKRRLASWWWNDDKERKETELTS